MDNVNEWAHLIFRWMHVVAGVMWIGHLWFFNFVNAQVAKTYTPEGKKQVLPELIPRALYWFRWGAAYTLVSGLVLLFLLYWFGGYMGAISMGTHAVGGIALVAIIVAFPIYEAIAKNVKDEKAAAAVYFVLTAAFSFGLSRIMGGRALFMHVGGLFGTIMAANVWMRIWPNQRKIIAGVKGTQPAPGPEVAALAGLRSKHNTYMSVPLIFFMTSNHYSTIVGNDYGWIIAVAFVAAGWGITKFFYTKSATPAPAAF